MKFKINEEKMKKRVLFLKNFPWLVGENVFPFFVTMIFVAILVSTLFFIRYIILIDRYYKIPSSQLPTLNEKTLESILETWQQRQDRLDSVNSKAYPNLFLPKSE